MSELISRKAVIDAISTWDKFGVDERVRIVRWREGLEPYVKLRDVITAIFNTPSEQPERKRGKWVYCEDSIANCVGGYRCDRCGFFVPWDYQHKGIYYIDDYHFCPNCGADMRLGEQDG